MNSEDGSIIPQVANFGHSNIYTNSNTTVEVTRTAPWHAPEAGTQRREYTHLDAIRADIFSFGMLSLWVLFRDEVAKQFGVTPDFADDCEHTKSKPALLFTIMTSLKDQDRLRPFCKNVIQSLSLETSQKENLAELFELTLSPHPKDRTSSLQVLGNYLNSCLKSQASDRAALVLGSIPVNPVEGQHFEFEVGTLFPDRLLMLF